MTPSAEFVKKLPNDIGGASADRIDCRDHELQPWEKRCHALADVLDYHKILNTEEKRRGVAELGTELIGKLSYYERWVTVFANILFQKQILTPEELAIRMGNVAARHSREAAELAL
jgi:nitrile hydratase beta subunit-like protein